MKSSVILCNSTSLKSARGTPVLTCTSLLSRGNSAGRIVRCSLGHSLMLSLMITVAASVVASVVASTAMADPVCVISERANLRKGPGSSFPVSWEVGQNMPLDRVGKKGGWVQVKDLDGESHWISSSSISGRVNCVVVRTKMASLHQSAGPRAPASELAFADRYTPFKKIDRDDAWIQVQDDHGAKYWINETNVWIPVMHSRVEF